MRRGPAEGERGRRRRIGPKEPVRLRFADGSQQLGPLGANRQVALYGRALHEGRRGLVEVVAGRRRRDGSLRMRSRSKRERYPRAGDQAALVALVARSRAAGEEVFCTPLARAEAVPGRAAVKSGWIVWVDMDDELAVERARGFRHRPQMVVASGSGGAHAYWRLGREAEGETIETINRKLAHALGGDLGSCDRGRIMRVPGTINYKARRWCRIVWADLAGRGFDPDHLVEGLEDPKPPHAAAGRRKGRLSGEADEASEVAPPEYFRRLAGVEVGPRGGYVVCPLADHREEVASCMVYAEAERGWWCYGCQRGGTVYDLASLLGGGKWGRELRGEEFRRARRDGHERLGIPMSGGRPVSGTM